MFDMQSQDFLVLMVSLGFVGAGIAVLAAAAVVSLRTKLTEEE